MFVAHHDSQVLDISGPLEILAAVNEYLEREVYKLELVAEGAEPIHTTSGLRVCVDKTFDDVVRDGLDDLHTLVVVGGQGTRVAARNMKFVEFVRSAASQAIRVVSVCSGAFVLAAAGLLDGKRATTHWNSLDLFERLYPKVTVDRNSIYVRDGKVWTSAGVTAGIDLALALVEVDHGREVALDNAKRHVVFLKRPGGQAQFSALLTAQGASTNRLASLLDWISDNLAADLSVPNLASRMSLSERTFSRHFKAELGVTPARFIELARIEAAKNALSDCRLSVDQIAVLCGFESSERMRRSFHRILGVSPDAYRSRFCSASFERNYHANQHLGVR